MDNKNNEENLESVSPESGLIDQLATAHQSPIKPGKKSKKLTIIIAFTLLFFAIVASSVFLIYKNNDESTTPNADTQDQSIISNINTRDQLTNLNDQEQTELCTEIASYSPDSSEIKDLHDRLGYDGSLYENLQAGCLGILAEKEYLDKDVSGENDDYYSRDTDKAIDRAKLAGFDLYDSTYPVPSGLIISQRSVLKATDKDAAALYTVYSTLVDGSYSPYSSDDAIKIKVIYLPDFTDLTTNCGPGSQNTTYIYQYNQEDCKPTTEKFMGNIIHKGDRLPMQDKGKGTGGGYSVTIGSTRIIVTARSEQESIEVIKSMEIAEIDNLDFFSRY